MSPERRRELLRRYRSLGLGELVAAAVFVVLAAAVLQPRWSGRDWATLWWGLGPLVLVLVQAGVYWLLARSWVGTGTMPTRPARAYRAFRILDPLLLAVGIVVIVVRGGDDAGALVLTLGVWLFAVVEFVNYFVVRLAYPPTLWLREVTRWRSPRLVRDLRG
ncbi:hypothetical protein SGUI_1631 [Serinicoccus hydrothermalis]|uniref:Uncharacterized protein n=1 Tax=Serinicoccus hydrothermalis TaxID=1758689 RepID=A0A1B1NC69_9MICO|nr:hypothetical protein [Serinicoccus hydrothermalis]ANS79027.1 hypothetical protein SGUI_1631 [Serinicoccus hydrothermalis]